MRKERKILRFVPQKLRKSFANGNPILAKQEDQPQRAEEQQEKTQQMGTFTYSVSSFPRKS